MDAFLNVLVVLSLVEQPDEHTQREASGNGCEERHEEIKPAGNLIGLEDFQGAVPAVWGFVKKFSR